ncbi:YrhC family protein [Peribacillus deserti]|uniref:Uncharacterized protein n=1 Tax=Peribacillus deserti TaxID=673318 RepID=A0A2N5M987_9BACI|nr:YrhC family protein [Peribacillus deserti]PLT30912.1 hypothetical protein CUU66_05000 [Peribacillus deserti]
MAFNEKKKSMVTVYREKMIDYKRFAFVLMCASVFFYLGVMISSYAKHVNPDYVMMGATLLFIALAAIFFYLSAKYRKLVMKSEEIDI